MKKNHVEYPLGRGELEGNGEAVCVAGNWLLSMFIFQAPIS